MSRPNNPLHIYIYGKDMYANLLDRYIPQELIKYWLDKNLELNALSISRSDKASCIIYTSTLNHKKVRTAIKKIDSDFPNMKIKKVIEVGEGLGFTPLNYSVNPLTSIFSYLYRSLHFRLTFINLKPLLVRKIPQINHLQNIEFWIANQFQDALSSSLDLSTLLLDRIVSDNCVSIYLMPRLSSPSKATKFFLSFASQQKTFKSSTALILHHPGTPNECIAIFDNLIIEHRVNCRFLHNITGERLALTLRYLSLKHKINPSTIRFFYFSTVIHSMRFCFPEASHKLMNTSPSLLCDVSFLMRKLHLLFLL